MPTLNDSEKWYIIYEDVNGRPITASGQDRLSMRENLIDIKKLDLKIIDTNIRV